MKADISEIVGFEGASAELDFEEALAGGNNLAEGFAVEKPIRFKGTLTNVNGILMLNGKLRFEYKATCSRCAEELEEYMEIRIDEDFVNSEELAEELDAYIYGEKYLEIDKAVKDNIILNLPTKKLCKPDCKGLCPVCGTDLNKEVCGCREEYVNPQMEKLKGFLKN